MFRDHVCPIEIIDHELLQTGAAPPRNYSRPIGAKDSRKLLNLGMRERTPVSLESWSLEETWIFCNSDGSHVQ